MPGDPEPNMQDELIRKIAALMAEQSAWEIVTFPGEQDPVPASYRPAAAV